MSKETWINSVRREWWNDVTRQYTSYGPTGTLLTTRAYTVEENAAADAFAAEVVQQTNKSSVVTNLTQDFAAMAAIKAQTNADLRADPSQEIKDIAVAVRHLTRIALGDYSGTD